MSNRVDMTNVVAKKAASHALKLIRRQVLNAQRPIKAFIATPACDDSQPRLPEDTDSNDTNFNLSTLALGGTVKFVLKAPFKGK